MKDTRWLLLLRWVVLNVFGLSLLGIAAYNEWIQRVVEADVTYISVGIFCLFLYGMALTGIKAWKLSKELNAIKSNDTTKSSLFKKFVESNTNGVSFESNVEAIKVKLLTSLAIIPKIAEYLTTLGLIGTVVGFIIAFGGSETLNVSNLVGNNEALIKVLLTVLSGLSVALYTTLVGAVLALWLTVNYSILQYGAGKILSNILEKNKKDVQ